MIVCIPHAKVGYRHAIIKRKPRARKSAGVFVPRRFVYRLSRLLSSGHDALFSEATQEAHEHFLAVDDIVEAVQP